MLITHLVDLLNLLLYVFASLFILVGWGSLIKRLIGAPINNLQISDGWIGLFGAVLFIETCHLWIPIDWKVSLVFAGIGLFELFTALKSNPIAHFWHSNNRLLINLFFTTVGLFFLFTWGSLAMTTPSIYDGGLYHFQAIRWINEFPIILGLGNLSGRLAFNQSYFGYLALLNLSPLLNKGYGAGSLLLMVLASATLIEAQFSKLRGGWWLSLWIFIAFIEISRYLSSPSPDVAVVIVQCAAFIFLIKTYATEVHKPDVMAYNVLMVFLLSCLLVTLKLSAVIFASMAILLLIPVVKMTYVQFKKLYICAFGIACYFIALHLFRGILLSGLPLYPSSLGAIWQLDWSVSFAQAKDEADWIYSWARDASKPPSEVLGTWSWLSAWTDHFFKEHWRYIYGALVLISIDILTLVFSKNRPDKKLFSLFLPFFAAIVFWFFTAPDWRFLGAIPQLLIALSGFLFIRNCIPESIFCITKKVPSFLTSSFTTLVILLLMVKTADFRTLPLSGWHVIPTARVSLRETPSGLKVFIPIDSDQCWDSPLPCAPRMNEHLRLRSYGIDEAGIKSGFSIQK